MNTSIVLRATVRPPTSGPDATVPLARCTGHDESDSFDRLVGRSPALTSIIQKARRLAVLDASVLLQGETGVGKELFARAIHESGPRKRGPFIAVNCGGLPRDLVASELFGYVDGAFTGARRSGMV